MEAIPNTFTSISFRIAFTASGDRIDAFNMAPALLTSRVTSEHCLTAALMSLVELTSSCTGITRESVIFDGSRAPPYTFAAPEDSSASTYALPKPRFAPVTSAMLPVMFMDLPNHWMIFAKPGWSDLHSNSCVGCRAQAIAAARVCYQIGTVQTALVHEPDAAAWTTPEAWAARMKQDAIIATLRVRLVTT